MSDFRRLTDGFWASQQITLDDVQEAAAHGFRLIVNNRPEGESDDQTPAAEIEAEARRLDMDYVAIPVTHAGFSRGQVDALALALSRTEGPTLAYCRSGTRSSLLWALAQASLGADLDAVAQAAAGAGYDVTPVRAVMDMLATNTGG